MKNCTTGKSPTTVTEQTSKREREKKKKEEEESGVKDEGKKMERHSELQKIHDR